MKQMQNILWHSSSCIDMNVVRKYNKLPWNKNKLSYNIGLRMSDVIELDLPNAIDDWSMYYILTFLVTLEDVIKYNTYPWNRLTMSYSKNFDIKIVYVDMPNAINAWHWHSISEHASIEDVINNPDLPWDRSGFSFGKNGMELYHMNLDLPNAVNDWCHVMLSREASIDMLRKYPNYEWNRTQISYLGHRNFHIDMLTMDLPNAIGKWNWDWNRISHDVSMDVVMNNPNLPWDPLCFIFFNSQYNVRVFNAIQCYEELWYAICNYVTLDDVKNNPNIRWNRKYLSGNYSLDRSVIELELPNAVDEWPEDHNTRIKLTYKNSYMFDEDRAKAWRVWFSTLGGNISNNIIRTHILHDITEDDIDYILSHPDYRWNRSILTVGGRLVYKLLDARLPNAIGEWDWKYISKHVPIEYIALHPLFPWNRQSISENKDMQLYILDIHMPNAIEKWDYKNICSNINRFEIMKYTKVIMDMCKKDYIKINQCLTEDIIFLLDYYSRSHTMNIRNSEKLADVIFTHSM